MGAKKDLRTMFLRCVLVAAYCILGAAIFYAIEHEDGYEAEMKRKADLYNSTKTDIMKRFHLNETEFEVMVSKVREAQSETPFEWSFSRGIDLAWQSMTTIGYGNKPPVTSGGRLFLIPFSLLGIPLTVFMLNTVGENICHFIAFMISTFEKKILKREEVRHASSKLLALTCILQLFVILMMAGISTNFDEWSFATGIYAWFVTFSTIGFGDFIPGNKSDAKAGIPVVLYRVFFVVLGLSLFSTILNAISDFIASPTKPTCRGCFCFPCSGKKETIHKVEVVENTNGGIEKEEPTDNVEMQQYV